MADKQSPDKIREINALRFGWHERVLADAELRRFPTALVLAGHIMHRFNPGKGYAEMSFNSAAKTLKMERGSVIRARDKLLERCWIAIKCKPLSMSGGNLAIRYTLTGGPDDLLIDEHDSGHILETMDPEIPT